MREIKLDLVGTSVATSYRFRERGELPCWAICTVNDETGELTIQSDWGSWTHRWNASPKALGAPTLTHFLADMDHSDYVARKLNREGRGEDEFDVAATAAVLKGRILERRREDGRRDEYVARWERDLNPGLRRRHLDRHTARQLWEEVEDLAVDLAGCEGSEATSALFFERLSHDFHVHIEEPWDCHRTKIRRPCIVLREAILPALFAACKAEVEKRRAGEIAASIQADSVGVPA